MTSILPDPGQLDAQLQQVRDAQAHLERVATWLAQGIELLGAAPTAAPPAALPPADPPTPDKPARRAAPARKARQAPAPRAASLKQRDVEGKVLGAAISASRPLSADELCTAAGVEKNGTFRKAVRALVDGGKLEATGNTAGRRYASKQQEGFHSAHRARTEAPKARNRSEEADRVAQIGLRERALKAIAADDGQLNLDRLSFALDEEPANVTKACEALIAARKIVLRDDGTYSRNIRMEVAAA